MLMFAVGCRESLGKIKFETKTNAEFKNWIQKSFEIAKRMKSQSTKLVRISKFIKCNWENPAAILLNLRNLLDVCLKKRWFVSKGKVVWLQKKILNWWEKSKNQYLLLQSNNAIIRTFSYCIHNADTRALMHAHTKIMSNIYHHLIVCSFRWLCIWFSSFK